jgi:hypothetical protein
LSSRLSGFAVLVAQLIASQPAPAMPEGIQLGRQTLAPVSCGVRSTLWIEHYATVLYLPGRGASSRELMDPASAKVLRLKLVSTRLIPHDIPRRWREPIAQHLSADDLARVSAAYRNLRPGDRVTFAYAPGEGAVLLFNERRMAAAPDHSLIDDVLRTWAGGESLPDKLRRVIERNPCRPGTVAAG